ncbi:origin recognition complex subunit 4 [Orobanche minor]
MDGRHSEEAVSLLRSRICNPNFILSSLILPTAITGKLKFVVSSSVTEAGNNSVLLLSPRGYVVLELVIEDLLKVYPDMITIKLDGVLHSDDSCALKASFDDNSRFMVDMLLSV